MSLAGFTSDKNKLMQGLPAGGSPKPGLEGGKCESLFALALYCGSQGVELDYAEGLKWSLLAAKQGHTTAQYNVAVAYENGQGVHKDILRAFVWFDLAAQSAKTQTCLLDKTRSCSPSKSRDNLRKQLSKAEIAKAAQLIQRCKETNYQQCD